MLRNTVLLLKSCKLRRKKKVSRSKFKARPERAETKFDSSTVTGKRALDQEQGADFSQDEVAAWAVLEGKETKLFNSRLW